MLLVDDDSNKNIKRKNYDRRGHKQKFVANIIAANLQKSIKHKQHHNITLNSKVILFLGSKLVSF